MPVVSQAQRRLMYAAEEGKVPSIKPSVGKEFVDASHGVTGLPEHVRKTKLKRAYEARRKPQ